VLVSWKETLERVAARYFVRLEFLFMLSALVGLTVLPLTES
jgi:hypothetical protein